MSEKKAYTPAEFAALFGREKTWSYRLLYAGKIKGISDYGRMMIPASEAKRIEGEGTRYVGKKKLRSRDIPEVPKLENPPLLDKGKASWSKWIEKRRNKPSKAKGAGCQAKPVIGPRKGKGPEGS